MAWDSSSGGPISPRGSGTVWRSSFLVISTGLWFAGRFWPWGWVVGVVLLLMAGPSKAEKKGYHDF